MKLWHLFCIFFSLLIYSFAVQPISAPISAPIAHSTSGASSVVNSASRTLPSLYIFSSKTCPACWMMKPTIEKVSKKLTGRISFVELLEDNPLRRGLMREFMDKIEIRYAPTFVVSDAENNVLAYARGMLDEQSFEEIITEGLEKYQKLPFLQVSNVLLFCNTKDTECNNWDQVLEAWLASNAEQNLQVDKFDLSAFQTEEEFVKFQKKIKVLKYLSGLEFSPALVFSTQSGEAIELFQSTVIKPLSLNVDFLNNRLAKFMPKIKNQEK